MPPSNANGVDYVVCRFRLASTRFLDGEQLDRVHACRQRRRGRSPRATRGACSTAGTHTSLPTSSNGNSEVLRYDTTPPFTTPSSFTDPSSWTTFDPKPPSGGGYVGGAFDGRYVYFSPYRHGLQSIGEVLRYDTQSPVHIAGLLVNVRPERQRRGHVSKRVLWARSSTGATWYFSPEHQTGSHSRTRRGAALRHDASVQPGGVVADLRRRSAWCWHRSRWLQRHRVRRHLRVFRA